MLLPRTTLFSLSNTLKCHVNIRPVTIKISLRYNSNSQSRWLQRQNGDVYTREAKLQNLRSRAAFKLIEIDEKFKIFNKDSPESQHILDLGFAPGSWSQIAKRRASPNSIILGVDLLACKPIDGVHSIQANILSKKTHELIRIFFNEKFKLNVKDKLDEEKGYFIKDYEHQKENTEKRIYKKYPCDIILSDMLMNTSGVAIRDHLRSIDLCDAALITAIDLLKPGGTFVCKLYTGEEETLFKNRLQKVFRKVSKFKPISSRTESKEAYYIGQDKKSEIDKIDVFTN